MFRSLALMTLSGSLLAGAAAAQTGGDGPPMAGMGRMVMGTVTAVAPDHLTIKTESGDTYQVAVSANTRLSKDRQPLRVADVHVGDGVGAMGEIDQPTRTVHALFVGVRDAEQMRKAREAMGKTFIAGKVTAIDELKLTILRSDGVTQTIAVDEDTSFKKGGRGMQMMMGGGPVQVPPPGQDGGESVTLADVKVGDSVAGPGTLKSGVFVPTQLMIGTPGHGGGGARRRRPGGDAPGGAPNPSPNTSPNTNQEPK